jgi:hypothetical protein
MNRKRSEHDPVTTSSLALEGSVASRALPARRFFKPTHPPERVPQVLSARWQEGFKNLRLLASPKIPANNVKRSADARAQRFNAFGVAQRLIPIRWPARGGPVRGWQSLL